MNRLIHWWKNRNTRVQGLAEYLSNPNGMNQTPHDSTKVDTPHNWQRQYTTDRRVASWQEAKKMASIDAILLATIQLVIYLIFLWRFGKMHLHSDAIWALYALIALVVAITVTVLIKFVWYFVFTFPNEQASLMLQHKGVIEDLRKQVAKLQHIKIRLTFDKAYDLRSQGKSIECSARMENISTDSIDEVEVVFDKVSEQTNDRHLHHLAEFNAITQRRLRDANGETQFTLHPSAEGTFAYRIVMFNWIPKTRKLRFGDVTVPRALERNKSYELELLVRGRGVPESKYSCWLNVDDSGNLGISLVPVAKEGQIL